ncbi:hypothetical protein BDZ91DRAFT_801045 [Kalaharituber pfeilii]|nr:hypothetical protein BDZ91DRAFT_801045 [Kalaharituber pfeilii]
MDRQNPKKTLRDRLRSIIQKDKTLCQANNGRVSNSKKSRTILPGANNVFSSTTLALASVALPGLANDPSSTTPVRGSSLLNSELPPTRNLIEAIIEDLKETQADARKRHWHESIGKILKSVEHYARIVDVAIQHSPQITALVWAGVRLIMKVGLNYIELVENLEFTTATIVMTMALKIINTGF